jgi:hypothetical protein
MDCKELAGRIERLHPEASPRDVARLCLLLTNRVDDLGELDDDRRLSQAWYEMGVRLQAVTDQHAAVAADIEELSRQEPARLSLDQIWILIRAIKVQSQILQLYVGQPAVEA